MKRDAQPEDQGLLFDATEKSTEEGPEALEDLALQFSSVSSPEEAEGLLRRALASAEAQLGPDFEKTYRGRFWLDHDTRPYMDLLAALSELLEVVGRRKESMAVLEKLLKLNPNDNQGVRYRLIGLLLAERMLPKTRKLFETYPDEASGWFLWAEVLYWFVMKDRPKATRLLRKARKENAFVELYITGHQEIPDELPDSYTWGSEEEAMLIAIDLGEAWSRRQNALFWLHGQLSGDPSFVRHVARIIDGR